MNKSYVVMKSRVYRKENDFTILAVFLNENDANAYVDRYFIKETQECDNYGWPVSSIGSKLIKQINIKDTDYIVAIFCTDTYDKLDILLMDLQRHKDYFEETLKYINHYDGNYDNYSYRMFEQFYQKNNTSYNRLNQYEFFKIDFSKENLKNYNLYKIHRKMMSKLFGQLFEKTRFFCLPTQLQNICYVTDFLKSTFTKNLSIIYRAFKRHFINLYRFHSKFIYGTLFYEPKSELLKRCALNRKK